MKYTVLMGLFFPLLSVAVSGCNGCGPGTVEAGGQCEQQSDCAEGLWCLGRVCRTAPIHHRSLDAGLDGGTDAGFDGGQDAALSDSGTDAETDSGSLDAQTDGGADIGQDAGQDSGMDTGTDTGLDAGEDTGFIPSRCDMNDKFARVLENASVTAAELSGDGAFIIVGGKSSEVQGSSNAYWAKLGHLGEVEWTKEIGQAGKTLTANLLLAVEDKGFVIAGYLSDYADYRQRSWLAKISAKGEIEWSTTYGEVGEIQIQSLRSSGDGGLIVAGSSKAGPWLARLNALGEIQWQRNYHHSSGTVWSESHYLVADATHDGNIFAASSYIMEGMSADNADVFFWVGKLASDGTPEWVKKHFVGHNGGATYYDANIVDVISSEDGGCILVGEDGWVTYGSHSSSSYQVNWALKLDSSGNQEWKLLFDGKLKPTGDGGFLIADSRYSGGFGFDGSEDYDLFVAKLNQNRNVEWQYSFGPGRSATSLLDAGDGQYFFSSDSSMVMKMNATGFKDCDCVPDLWSDGSGEFKTGNPFAQEDAAVDYVTAQVGSSDLTYTSSDSSIAVKSLCGNPYGGLPRYYQIGDGCCQTEAFSVISGGNGIIAGSALPGVDGKPRDDNLWAVRLSPNGGIVSKDAFHGYGESDLRAVLSASDGGYLLSGEMTSNLFGGKDIWIVKFAADSSIVWQQAYGTSADEGVWEVIEVPDGGFLVSGWSGSEDGTILFRISDAGKILWQKQYRIGSKHPRVAFSSDGGIMMAGDLETSSTTLYIVRLDSAGAVLSAKGYDYGGDWGGLSHIYSEPDGDFTLSGTLSSYGYSYGCASGCGFACSCSYSCERQWLVKATKGGEVKSTGRYFPLDAVKVSSIRPGISGSVILSGSLKRVIEHKDYYVCPPDTFELRLAMELDLGLSLKWARTYGVVGQIVGSFYDIQSSGDGGYIASACCTQMWRLNAGGTVDGVCPEYLTEPETITLSDLAFSPLGNYSVDVNETTLSSVGTSMVMDDLNVTVENLCVSR